MQEATTAFVILACLAASGGVQAARSTTYRLPEAGVLILAVDGERVRASLAPPPKAAAQGNPSVVIDPRLDAVLRAGSDVVAIAGRGFVAHGKVYLVVGVARPSVARLGSGYCGAGSEDSLLLVEWRPQSRRLALRDRLTVQSCLTSMELRSDHGGDLPSTLRGIEDPARITLDWLSHPQHGSATRTLTVGGAGRFVLSP